MDNFFKTMDSFFKFLLWALVYSFGMLLTATVLTTSTVYLLASHPLAVYCVWIFEIIPGEKIIFLLPGSAIWLVVILGNFKIEEINTT